jgi:eukaryotic-like serine/threonine-protein kinase
VKRALFLVWTPREHVMKFLSDKAVDRLRQNANLPNLSGTRYQLLERVARGGMGTVYAARDETLDRRVALKVLDVPVADGDLARRLNREARVLALLEHPGIVPVHDVGTLSDGRVFYTMKFVEGQRLDKYIEAVTSLPDRLRLFLRICDAVAFAHARGVLHRDLKPANVMVGAFGEVLVMDWGLAKILREQSAGTSEDDPDATIIHEPPASNGAADSTHATQVTGQGTVLGTPGYMSPEQASGDIAQVNERSDIFSLGAVLRFLCINPATQGNQNSASQRDKALEAICAKATESNPANRYAKVTELSADVSRYLDGLPVSARQETIFDKAVRFYRRYTVAILLIAAYLIMRILLLIFSHR